MSKQPKFEQAMKRLEEIVAQMEGGELDLDKSLGLFEEGMKLVRLCSSKLEESKKKIEILSQRGETMVREPFGTGDENSTENGTADSGDLFK